MAVLQGLTPDRVDLLVVRVCLVILAVGILARGLRS